MKSFSKKLKRGISLIEVVIAVFIITLMSAAATTLILTSAKNDQKNIRYTQIALSTKATVDCFRYAEDIDDFYSALILTDDDYVKSNDLITLDKGSFSLSITSDFLSNQITITILDGKGQELSVTEYKKG